MNKWIFAARLKTLPAAISPVLVGVSLAIYDGKFQYFIGLMTLIAAVLLQIGANFANDVYDYLNGSDGEDRVGPIRMTQAGLISPKMMLKGVFFVFLAALLIGVYLSWIGGWPIVLIGLTSIGAALAYTGGPYPLGYHGWGDLMVFIFFGIIAVPGTYYLQTGLVSFESIIFGFSMGALSTAILVVNNLRDADTDVRSGKRTLAVRWGKTFAKFEYSIIMLLAFFMPVIFLKSQINQSIIGIYLLLPFVVKYIQTIFTKKGTALNSLLTSTGILLFSFSIILSIGLIFWK